MILYSRELLKHFLGQQWMLDYNMVEDTGFSEEELKVLYQKARSGELLQQKTSKKRIDLPASVFFRFSVHIHSACFQNHFHLTAGTCAAVTQEFVQPFHSSPFYRPCFMNTL